MKPRRENEKRVDQVESRKRPAPSQTIPAEEWCPQRWWSPAGCVVLVEDGSLRWETTQQDKTNPHRILLSSGPLVIRDGVGFMEPSDRTIPTEKDLMEEWFDTLPEFSKCHFLCDVQLDEGNPDDEPWFCMCAQWATTLDQVEARCAEYGYRDSVLVHGSEMAFFPHPLWKAFGYLAVENDTSRWIDGSEPISDDSELAPLVGLDTSLGPGLSVRTLLVRQGNEWWARAFYPVWDAPAVIAGLVWTVQSAPDGLVGHLTVTFGNLLVECFVSNFWSQAKTPEVGTSVKIRLGGVAQTCHRAKRKVLRLTRNCDISASPTAIHSYSGRVSSVDSVAGTDSDWFSLSIEVHRDAGDEVWWLPILVRKEVWRKKFPPEIGTWVQGTMVMLGNLN